MPINGIGRPFKEEKQSVKITIRMTKNEKEKLDIYCKKNNVSISEIFREFLKKIK